MIIQPDGWDQLCSVLYVEMHSYSVYDVRLLISKFISLFRAANCKFPVQVLETQNYSCPVCTRYQAIMI